MSSTGTTTPHLAAADQNSTVLLRHEQIFSDCSFLSPGGLNVGNDSLELFHRYTDHHIFERPVGGALKHAIDVLISFTGLVLLAPTLVLVALLIYLVMGRPILFVPGRLEVLLDEPFRLDIDIRQTLISLCEREIARKHLRRIDLALKLAQGSIGEWDAVCGGPVVATAIVDRMLHHSQVITIRSYSYRLKEKRRSGGLQKIAPTESKPHKKD